MKTTLALSLFAVSCLSAGVGTLAPPADIYIATTGSNSNPGTSGSPYLTLAYALAQLPQNPKGCLDKPYTIHVANGTYGEPITVEGFCGTYLNSITILGNTAIPTTVNFSGTVTRDTNFQNENAISGAHPGLITTYDAFIDCKCRVVLSGLQLTGSANVGAGFLNGTYSQIDHFQSNGATLFGIYARANVWLEISSDNTLANWTQEGIECAYTTNCTFINAGTFTVTGPGGTASIGMSTHFSSTLREVTASGANVAISATNTTHCFELAFNSTMNFDVGSVSCVNASTPSGSAIVHETDVSTWSANGGFSGLTGTNFTNSLILLSLAYAENTASHTYTNVGAAVVTQNSVNNGL